MSSSACALPGLLVCLCTLTAQPAQVPVGGGTLRVGMVQTFFHDMTAPLVQAVTEPFIMVMRDTTGLAGELAVGGTPFDVAKQLADNKLQLAVFHGVEFAWVQQKYPDVQPLMIAVNGRHELRASIVIRKDNPAKTLTDLKGKDLGIGKRTKEHCRLFLERSCRQAGASDAKAFFGKVVSPANVETTLDQLVKGKIQAAVVDSFGLDFYKDLKPGAYARLKVLTESDIFAPLVIAYHKGAVPEATLGRIRDGLRNAHKTEMGREMMKTWKITSFEAVPDTFAQTMTASLKAYPAAAAKN